MDSKEPVMPETNTQGTKRDVPTTPTDLPPKPKKVFPKRAEIWKHFTQQAENPSKANCRYCGTEICCDSKLHGTSSMKSHNEKCKSRIDYDEREKQKVLSSDSAGNMKVIKYDPLLIRRAVNKMVVLNELPFSFVETEGWKDFCHDVLPLYQTFSRRTCTRDIIAMYLEARESLKNLFRAEKQRVSLTTNIWVSPTTSCNYMVVTAHWIDRDWKMQKRILSFKVITDHKGETIAGQLIDCIEEWGIEKVFTITVDNAKANDKALAMFTDDMRLRGPEALVLNGNHLHMRCCAHVLNLIVGDGLRRASNGVIAIRNAVKYVRSSFTRLMSFEMRCETGKVARGSLPLDCVTRWNSTYLMLSSAIKLRVAFDKMAAEDKLYCDYFTEEEEEDDDSKKKKTKRVGPPTNADWEDVSRLCKFLKIFYTSTVIFSASKTVSSTLCYNEIVNIERSLITKTCNKDKETRVQANIMRNKFDKYWDGLINMNELIIIASVFDPRNKMQFASLCFDQLYGKDTVESGRLHASVTSLMKRLYEEYNSRLGIPIEAVANVESQETQESMDVDQVSDMNFLSDDDDDGCEPMMSIYNKMVNLNRNAEGSSELDIYLAEKTETRVENSLGLPYDVLHWWMCNSSKFPVLSQLAKDVLSVQVSSVASESVFSTSGRVLDPYRSSLTPFMIEVLLCTQQWLRSETQVANLAQMLEEVDFFESLDSRNSIPPSQ